MAQTIYRRVSPSVRIDKVIPHNGSPFYAVIRERDHANVTSGHFTSAKNAQKRARSVCKMIGERPWEDVERELKRKATA